QLRYLDRQNTFPGHSVHREYLIYVNEPTEAMVRIVDTRFIKPEPGALGSPKEVYLPRDPEASDDHVAGMSYEIPLTVEVFDPDAAKDSLSKVTVALSVGDEKKVDIECDVSGAYGEATTAPEGVDNWALYEGRFIGQIVLRLGGANSPDRIPLTADMPMGLVGGVKKEASEESDVLQDLLVPVLNVTGQDVVSSDYVDALRPDNEARTLAARGRLITDGVLSITGPEYAKDVETVYLGEKLYIVVNDPDLDVSSDRDTTTAMVTTARGEKETVTLEETLGHSGYFTGAFPLKAQEKPSEGNQQGLSGDLECFFGDIVTVTYNDARASTETGEREMTSQVNVAIGTDGAVAAFSKIFGDEELAIQTQF
ncbi:MAG: hypothetical protein AAF492_30790, partial [Verrucomicrobiota bacterium]